MQPLAHKKAEPNTEMKGHYEMRQDDGIIDGGLKSHHAEPMAQGYEESMDIIQQDGEMSAGAWRADKERRSKK